MHGLLHPVPCMALSTTVTVDALKSSLKDPLVSQNTDIRNINTKLKLLQKMGRYL